MIHRTNMRPYGLSGQLRQKLDILLARLYFKALLPVNFFISVTLFHPICLLVNLIELGNIICPTDGVTSRIYCCCLTLEANRFALFILCLNLTFNLKQKLYNRETSLPRLRTPFSQIRSCRCPCCCPWPTAWSAASSWRPSRGWRARAEIGSGICRQGCRAGTEPKNIELNWCC